MDTKWLGDDRMTIAMDCQICGVFINTHRPPFCSHCWDENDDEEHWLNQLFEGEEE